MKPRHPRCSVLLLLEATLGGTRRHVMDLLNGLDLDQFDVTFAYATGRADSNFFAELEELRQNGKIRLIEISMVRAISPWKDLRAFLKLFFFLRRNRFDIVHCHSSKAGFLGRVAAKLAHPSSVTVYTPHSMAFHVHRLYGYLERFASHFTNHLIAVSDSERDEICASKVISPSSIEVVPSGITTEATPRDLDLRGRLGLREESCVVVTVGRLCAQKDPLLFLEVARLAAEENESMQFLWIGDGEMRDQVEKRIDAYRLRGRFVLAGWRNDVRPLLAACDIFALTSRYECFGYVTCEAMAVQLPVVATNVSGSREIVVDEETGFLVPPAEPKLMAEKLRILVNQPALRHQFGSRGMKRVTEVFSVERMVQKTEGLYQRAVAQRSLALSLLESAPSSSP